MTQPTAAPRTTASPPSRFVLPIIAVGVLLSGFDLFIVNVALPDIAADLSVRDLSDLSWILNAYTITFAALLVPAGRLSDLIGSKRAFLGGLLLFTLASAACAASPNLGTLVTVRVIQAVGAAVMIPSSLGLVLAATPPEGRAKAVHTWAGLGGLGAALGPVLGGFLVQADWRWVFLINVPTGLVAVVAGWRLLPSPAGHPGSLPRPVGSLLLIVTVAALVGALVDGDQWGWTSAATLSLGAVAVVGLLLNVLTVARGVDPIVDLALLKAPHFTATSLNLLLFHVAFGAMLLSGVLWLQGEWGFSALQTGLAIAPGPLLVPVVASNAARVVAAIGARRTIALGGLTFAVAVATWPLLLEPSSGYAATFLPGMILTGIGVGLTVPPAMGLGTSGLPPHQLSTGSAVLSTARQVGIAVGVAVTVSTLQHSYELGWWISAAFALAAGALALTLQRPTR